MRVSGSHACPELKGDQLTLGTVRHLIVHFLSLRAGLHPDVTAAGEEHRNGDQ